MRLGLVAIAAFSIAAVLFFGQIGGVEIGGVRPHPATVDTSAGRDVVEPDQAPGRVLGEPNETRSSPDALAFAQADNGHDSATSAEPAGTGSDLPPRGTADRSDTTTTTDTTAASPGSDPTVTAPQPQTPATTSAPNRPAPERSDPTPAPSTPTSSTPAERSDPTPTPSTPAPVPTTTAPTTAVLTGSRSRAHAIAATAPTTIPVYDTAWQMLVRATPGQADEYFAALENHGFSGTWAGIIHHAPATYNLNFAGGGRVGGIVDGKLVLSDGYVSHVRSILDAAHRHGMKVGLVAAWQNLYLPGGGADRGIATSDAVRGSITTANAHAYGAHIAEEFGDHPAVGMWVFGGDAGTNNTSANKEVWREMARGVRDGGSDLAITYHTPTSEFDQLNYAGEPWLDFVAPETGHAQDAATTEAELRHARSAYGTPVWQGEPRYFNINFDWVNAAFRNPGVDEVRADAQAAKNAGVSGYVYGDAGRWTWCAGYGDSSPCSASNIAASFGAGEQAVIDVFSG